MHFGFEKNKWFIEYKSCQREPKNIREESLIRAKHLYNNYSNLILSFSGGLDSQVMFYSFLEQGLKVNTAFMHMPGYNDNELEQVKECNQRWKFSTEIVTVNPVDAVVDAAGLDIPNQNSLLHRYFVSLLPEDSTVIQNIGPPSIYINPSSENVYVFTGHYSLEVSRRRAFDSINRSVVYWDYEPEYLVSVLDHDIVKAEVAAFRYIDHALNNKNSVTYDRWDYFIKPFMYGMYWGKELVYFPKFKGYENIKFIKESVDRKLTRHSVTIPLDKFVENLKTKTTRYSE